MPIKITADILTEYAEGYMAREGRRKRVHDAYEETCCMYRALRVHANGETPTDLICERRPSESLYIKEYREKIYVPITKSNISKVISSLSKIRRSSDWSIKFPEKKMASIRKGEDLETYTNKGFPSFSSITNWLFSVCLKEYMLDANAVILTIPLNMDKIPADYYKPFPFVFNSPRVLDYVADDYAILLSDKYCSYEVKDNRGNILQYRTDGLIIHVVDNIQIVTYHQVSTDKKFVVARKFVHNLGVLPAFKMPGVFFKACDYEFINESRINGMLPHLDEAARIYSDLQAELVQHVHSEKWLYMNTDCTHCKGIGREIIGENDCECHVCHGVGKVPTSPYSNHIVTPPAIGELAQVPTPPAGYIQKTDVAEMCAEIDRQVEKHLYKSLAALNMQFLDQTPMNQSGTAKEVDKDELNNFVHACAEDLIYILDRVIFITNEYRISGLISDADRRAELLPEIAVPEKFDLLSSNFLLEEIQTAKQNNLNNLIISTLETDYAAKKFYNMPEVAQMLTLVFDLDPMPAITDEMKMVRLQNDGVTQEDYIISSNIVPFVKRALRENEKFGTLEYQEQMTILEGYAAAKQSDNSAADELRPEPETVTEEVVV